MPGCRERDGSTSKESKRCWKVSLPVLNGLKLLITHFNFEIW